MNYKKTKEREKGITLIALVITIIVLLILAGITIAFLTGENSIFKKATNAKIENEKAEIKEMLSLSVNTISVERGQKQDSLSNYYNEKETFIEKGKLDTTKYKINNYEYNEENKIVKITIYKENGTQNQYEYEINLGTGSIKFKNRGEIVDPDKPYTISYQLNNGKFEENADVVYEYKKGTIVGFLNPTKDGAAFDGWYLTSDFSGSNITQTTKDMQSNITLYAKWINESNVGYFTYSTNNGQDAITGFTELGKTAYNEGREDIINLVIPKKSDKGNPINAINQDVFKEEQNPKIKKVIIHDNIDNIGRRTFSGCNQMKELTIPISINASNYDTFANCTGLEKVTITKGNGKNIDYGDYSGNSYYYQRLPWYLSSQDNNVEIILGEGITRIGKFMFTNCKKIQMIKFPLSLKEIGNYSFSGCVGMQGEINSIENVTSIEEFAFDGCIELNGNVIIPNEVLSIGQGTFRNTKIEKLIIHDNVTSLGRNAFNGCSNLKGLTIPISINASNYDSFLGCTGIEKVTITKGNGKSIDYGDYSGNSYYYKKLPWYLSSQEHNVKVTLEEGITKIGNYMFTDCIKLQMVQIPTTIQTIGAYSFSGCIGMQGTFNKIDNVSSLGIYAFDGCTELTGEVIIPNGISSIGQGIFRNTKIERLVIHDNVTSIDRNAFNGCSNLKELTMPISLNASNCDSFVGCTGLEKVTITKGNGKSIDYGDYSGNSYYYGKLPWYLSSQNNNVEITLEEGITRIGNFMFTNCKKVQMIKFPLSLKEIGSYSFSGCAGMQGEINSIENVTSIGEFAFDGCTQLNGKVIVPNGVLSIGQGTFRNTKIEKLIIHDNVTSLGRNAFNGCSNLKELTIPISLNASIYDIFSKCSGLTKVIFTKGNESTINYGTYSGNSYYYQNLPWYISKDNDIKIIFNKDIVAIGSYTFYGLNNAKYYYKGSQEEWANVSVDSSNAITIDQYNYKE